MKSILMFISLAIFTISGAFADSQCNGRFTPFEMLNVGIEKVWITLRPVTETRQCESVYGAINCNDWKISTHASAFIGKLDLKLVSQNKTVFARGTHYQKTRGYFTWKSRETLMELKVTKNVSGRGSCRQWGASGGVGYGGCRSYNTVTREVFLGSFKGRVNEACAALVGPVTSSERTYFSDDTFAYTETRKTLKN
jgi:hypothetical protein